MRISLRPMFLASCILAAACNGGGGGDDDGDDDGTDIDGGTNPPAEGFRIQVPPITIERGQEVTYCYYTTLNIPRAMGVKKWSSTMTPGSHHLIVYFQNHDRPDGTIDQQCGGFGGGLNNLPVWVYAASQPSEERLLPPGIGMPVAQGQKAYVQMHYLNTSDAAIEANVVVDAEAYTAAESFTPAAAYITYNTQINIPPMSTGSAQGTCSVPAGTKFFFMGTHAHKRATLTRVTDGSSMVFESTNWEEPGARLWNAAPFYEFAAGSLTYRCEYDNRTGPTSGQNVQEGDSAATDEMCMAVGYYFIEGGQARTRYCANSFLVP